MDSILHAYHRHCILFIVDESGYGASIFAFLLLLSAPDRSASDG